MKLRKSTKLGRRKATYAFVEYKRRLHGVLSAIGGSGATRETITERLNANGCRVSRSSVTRWMTPSNEAVPDAYQMMVIGSLARDVSLDWLLGRRGPETQTERYITMQTRRL